MGIFKDKADGAVVAGSISVAKETAIKKIAEFIGSEEVLNESKEPKVDYAQGFYTGKPAENFVK